jgi:hypothetical protein
MYLCIRKLNTVKKIIDDIPAIKSLKIEPVLSVSATTTAAAILDYEESNSINGSLAAATVLTAGLAVVPSTVQNAHANPCSANNAFNNNNEDVNFKCKFTDDVEIAELP